MAYFALKTNYEQSLQYEAIFLCIAYLEIIALAFGCLLINIYDMTYAFSI